MKFQVPSLSPSQVQTVAAAGPGDGGALETSGARGPNSLPGLVACNPLCLVLQLQLPHI